MNNQTPIHETQPEPMSRREARRQRRRERFADPSNRTGWVTGVILIVLGVAFFLQNTTNFTIPLKNWWALFILIPAVGAFDTALHMYRSAGSQLTAPARGSLLVGLILTLVTAVFLFGLNWSYFGPILIILTGIGLLATYLFGNRE